MQTQHTATKTGHKQLLYDQVGHKGGLYAVQSEVHPIQLELNVVLFGVKVVRTSFCLKLCIC